MTEVINLEKFNEKNQGFRVAAVLIGLIFVYISVYYARLYYIKQQPMVTREELEKCELYIFNYSCPTFEYQRTVEDLEFFNQVMELCLKHKRFKTISTDGNLPLLGYRPSTAIFINGNDTYRFAIYELDGRRTLENVYDALPIITVSTPETGWHCILPQEDYVELFRLIETYESGDLI